METMLNVIMAALTPLEHLGERLMAVLPSTAGALLLLLIGGLLATTLRMLADRVLTTIRIDDYVHRLRLSEVLRRLGLGPSLTQLVGLVIFFTISIAFLLGAADMVGMTIVGDYLRRVADFLPRLIGVVFVLLGGLFIGDMVGGIVCRAAEANHIKGAETLMRVTHGLMVIFSALIAIEILGIPLHLFTDFLPTIMSNLGLGLAIAFGVAFGMAGRDVAGRLLRDLTPRSSKGLPMTEREPKMRVVK